MKTARSVNTLVIIVKAVVWGHRPVRLAAQAAQVPMTWSRLRLTLLESLDGFQPKAHCARKFQDAWQSSNGSYMQRAPAELRILQIW